MSSTTWLNAPSGRRASDDAVLALQIVDATRRLSVILVGAACVLGWMVDMRLSGG